MSWITGKCSEAQSQRPEGLYKASGSVRCGYKTAHDSHALLFSDFLGMHFCSTCGKIGRRSIKLLATECKGYANITGKANLARIKKGLMPGSSNTAQAFNKIVVEGRANL